MSEANRQEVPLVSVGCDFRSANVMFRERLVTTPEERAALHSGIASIEPGAGFAALETCNRVEWIVSTANPQWMSSLLTAQMVQRWQRGLPDTGSYPLPRTYAGRDAALHLLRVAAGLESLAAGEAQIAGQFQDAIARARDEKTATTILNGLAKHAGRLAKTGARIGYRSDHTRGIHGLTADYLNSYFDGAARGKTVAVVGMGSIGRKAAEVIEQRLGAKVIRINRTVDGRRARDWKKLSELADVIAVSDAIIVATGALSPVIESGHFESVANDRKILVMDIGIPRQVSSDAQSHCGVVYRNLDDLITEGGSVSDHLESPMELEAEKETDLLRRFCIERNIVSLLEETQRLREEFVCDQIPSIVERELSFLDGEARRQVEIAMKQLISNYSYSSFNSIHAALEKYWSEP